MGLIARQRLIFETGILSDAAHHVDFAARLDRGCGQAANRHRCQRPPRVGCRVVFPGVVDRELCRPARLPLNAAAEHVDLAVVADDPIVMRRLRHVLLLRPAIGGRVVLEHISRRRTLLAGDGDRISAKQIQLSVDDGAVPFLVWLRNGRKPHPAPLHLRADRCGTKNRKTARILHDMIWFPSRADLRVNASRADLKVGPYNRGHVMHYRLAVAPGARSNSNASCASVEPGPPPPVPL